MKAGFIIFAWNSWYGYCLNSSHSVSTTSACAPSTASRGLLQKWNLLSSTVMLWYLNSVIASSILHQHVTDGHRWRLAHVPRVLLEREAEHSDLLVRDGVEEAGDDLAGKRDLLVLVHVNDHLPILGNLVQALGFADVNQVQDIFLKARATKANGRAQELRPNPRIGSNCPRDLRHIGPGLFAELRNRVHAAHALCQHGIGHQFRQLRTPEVGGEDLLSGDPIRIDVNQHAGSSHAVRRCRAANQDPVRSGQVLHGCTFSEELWVRQDPKLLTSSLVGNDYSLQGLCRLHRHGGLLDDDLRAVRILCYSATHALDVTQVRCTASTYALDLRRCVHRGEDDVCLLNGSLDVSREEQVLSSASLDHLVQAWLVDGQVVRVPRCDPSLVQVHDGDLDVGTLQSDGRASWATDIACADAADLVQAHAKRGVLSWDGGSCHGAHRKESLMHEADRKARARKLEPKAID